MDGSAERQAKGLELEVRRCYHRSRTAEAVLASVYEQIVPSGGRSRLDGRRTDPERGQQNPQQKQLLCAGG
jgi:hypothetical protein